MVIGKWDETQDKVDHGPKSLMNAAKCLYSLVTEMGERAVWLDLVVVGYKNDQ